MSSIGAKVLAEIREVLPATIFFLFLFHLIGLTKAVSLDDYSITALRTAGATVGALIVAKAIVVVEALPIARLFPGRPILHVVWKTLLYFAVTLLFRFVEELIPVALKYGDLASATRAMFQEVSWPLFAVLSIWIFGGLFLYCLASELVEAVGREKVKQILFGNRSEG